MGATQNSLYLWPRKAIESIKNVLKTGLQFFKYHNGDNSTDGRISAGEYVGRLAKEVGGRLHEIIVGYFPDKELAKDCDICSMESDVAGSNITNGAFLVDIVDSITGIALDNSAHDTPAFAGAKRLASLQCFEGGNPLQKKTIQSTESTPGGNPMTYEELKAKAREMNVHPSQMFTLAEIRADREFAPTFDRNETLEAENKTLKEAGEEAGKKAAEQENKILRNDAKTRLNTFIPSDATKGQKDFIAKRVLKKFDGISDLTDEGLKKFVDDNIEDYNDFGGPVDHKKPDEEKPDPDPANQEEELSDEDEAIKDAVE